MVDVLTGTQHHREEEFRTMCPLSIICLTPVNVWESMGKPCSCTQFIKSRIFYYKLRENPYQVLQVTCAVSERAMKSKVHMIKSLSP